MSLRILIVDDEAAVAALLKDYFTQRGFEVETAADGELALQNVKRLRPDAIILDVMMPGMDGYTFMRELKKSGLHDIPVVVVTAREMMRDLFVEEGVKEYIVKPVLPAELEAIVRRILAK